MKFFYLLVVLCFSFNLSSQDWNLVWEDNFDGNSLDNSKWIHDIGTGTQYGLYGWGNGELQYYQSQNTTLNNGIAKITVEEEPNGLVDSWGNTSYYSSSKITTKGNFNFRYGKVEARIKTIDGEGFWPYRVISLESKLFHLIQYLSCDMFFHLTNHLLIYRIHNYLKHLKVVVCNKIVYFHNLYYAFFHIS